LHTLDDRRAAGLEETPECQTVADSLQRRTCPRIPTHKVLLMKRYMIAASRHAFMYLLASLLFAFSIVSLNSLFPHPAYADDSSIRKALLGSAYTTHEGYRVLQRICDEAGGRLPASPQNAQALRILGEELARNGVSSRQESFTMPGWVRGEDLVEILSPAQKKLRAAALGYTDHHPPLEAAVAWAGYGREQDLAGVSGRLALVTSEAPREGDAPLRLEVIENAARAGAKGVLFINDKPGGLVLTGVGNFQGKPNLVPAYSITLEEGKWLQRMLGAGREVRLQVATASRCTLVQTANLVASLPGKRKATIVVGAHIDSWDISQGAVDNGIGSATLFEAARLLSLHSPVNQYSIEFVWFNGEELGLWGSKTYLEQHKRDSIVAMINMDMIGRPTGINVMGFDEFIPLCRELMDNLKGFDWSGGIASTPWTNSDHEPFLLEGIPSFTMMGHLEKESVFHYHDFGDTFDKVDHSALVDASAGIAAFVHALANNTRVPYRIKSVPERIETFNASGMEKRLRRQGEWPY
jgi:Iap family predicted aminopeptidase